MVVPSLTEVSIEGATRSWLFREIPWSCRTSPTVSPVAVTWSTLPSTFSVTSLPIEAYPTVVPTTAAAATAAAPARAILLLLTCASFWRTALQTSYSPGLGWHLAVVSSPGGVVAAATHGSCKRLRVALTARSPRCRSNEPTRSRPTVTRPYGGLPTPPKPTTTLVTRLSVSEIH